MSDRNSWASSYHTNDDDGDYDKIKLGKNYVNSLHKKNYLNEKRRKLNFKWIKNSSNNGKWKL